MKSASRIRNYDMSFDNKIVEWKILSNVEHILERDMQRCMALQRCEERTRRVSGGMIKLNPL